MFEGKKSMSKVNQLPNSPGDTQKETTPSTLAESAADIIQVDVSTPVVDLISFDRKRAMNQFKTRLDPLHSCDEFWQA
jgi:hypothetical protein